MPLLLECHHIFRYQLKYSQIIRLNIWDTGWFRYEAHWLNIYTLFSGIMTVIGRMGNSWDMNVYCYLITGYRIPLWNLSPWNSQWIKITLEETNHTEPSSVKNVKIQCYLDQPQFCVGAMAWHFFCSSTNWMLTLFYRFVWPFCVPFFARGLLIYC